MKEKYEIIFSILTAAGLDSREILAAKYCGIPLLLLKRLASNDYVVVNINILN
jgi:hypothetical protein